MKTQFLTVAGAAAALSFASSATAGIDYGDFATDNFLFQSVTESSGTDDLPLYGAPSAVGDSLMWTPTMTSQAGGPGDADVTDGQMSFVISSLGGAGINALFISEAGDYTLFGDGGSATAAGVGAVFFIEVFEVDGFAITPILANYSTADLEFNLADDGEDIAAPWYSDLTIDIDALLAANDIDGEATGVSIVFNNTLVTTSESGTTAFIAKKDLNFVVIPAPGALCLLGLAGFIGTRRRRSAQA